MSHLDSKSVSAAAPYVTTYRKFQVTTQKESVAALLPRTPATLHARSLRLRSGQALPYAGRTATVRMAPAEREVYCHVIVDFHAFFASEAAQYAGSEVIPAGAVQT